MRSVWHRRARPAWRSARPLVLGALAVIVVVFGYIGFTRSDRRAESLDSAYRAIQLFTFGGGVGSHPNPWLEIARFLGPFVVGYAAIRGILALYRDQYQRGRLRLLRDHVVVTGAGAAGFRMATAFDEQDWHVVVIDRDPANVALEGCRERGIRVVVGDARDPHILRQAGVDHAILLVVMCGDDGVNVDVAAAARIAAGKRSRGVLTALVALDDLELWRVMRAQALIDRDQSPFRLELFNAFATAAEMLLDVHPPFGGHAPGASHVLVIGSDGVGSSLIAEIARRWLDAGDPASGPCRVTIAGPLADGERSRLLTERPELTRVPGFEVGSWNVDLTGDGIAGAPADSSRIYISLSAETEALRVALALRQQPALWKVPIVVAVADGEAGVGATISRGGPALADVYAFGILRRSLTPGALLHTTTEKIARVTHELHLANATAPAADPEDSSLVPWTELDGSLRESNRLFADGIAANLARVGCTVTAVAATDPIPAFCFTESELEELAPLEHARWEQAMTRIGYRYGPRKDHRHRRHPMIGVSWEDLPSANKEKDRDHVRSIPRTLAAAGFALRRIEHVEDRDRAAPDDERDQPMPTR